MVDYSGTETSGVVGTSRSSISGFLKIDYFDQLEDWIHFGAKTSNLVAKKRDSIGGLHSEWSVFTNPVASAGLWRAEGGMMPEPEGSTAAKPSVQPKRCYYRVRVSGAAADAARKGKKVAFEKTWKAELRLARDVYELNFCRDLHIGNHGILGIMSAVSTTTLTLDPRADRAAGADTTWFRFGNFAGYMKPGYELGFLDESTDATSSEDLYAKCSPDHVNATSNRYKISSRGGSKAAPTIVLNADPGSAGDNVFTPAANDMIVPYASRIGGAAATITEAAVNRAGGDMHMMNGLAVMVDDAEIAAYLFGLTKSSYDGLMGGQHDAAGTTRTYSEALWEYSVTDTHETTGLEIDTGITGRPVMREISDENRALRRWQPTMTKGGWSKLGWIFGDLQGPFDVDWMCPAGDILGLDKSDVGWYEQAPLSPVGRSGRIRFRPDYDEDEISAVKSGNEALKAPWGAVRLADLTFSDTGAPS